MKIRFRRKTQGEWVLLFVLAMPLLFACLIGFLGMPSFVKYTVDIGWLALLLLLLKQQMKIPNSQTKTLAMIIGLFFVSTLVGAIVNYQSFAYYLWGIRNNARMFVFFFACIYFLKQPTVSSVFKFFDRLFWINFLVVMYQYFVLGYSQDYLGGIFGVEKGCNAYTNIFMVIVVTRALLRYMRKEQKIFSVLLVLTASLVVAVLSELKVFFLELVLIAILAMMMTKFSFRKVWIIVGGTVGLLAASYMLGVLFPEFYGWLSFERIIEIATRKSGYTGRNDLNRLTVAAIVFDRFLPTLFSKFFGLGLGNCDYASFAFLTTPFYENYGRLNYTWFSSAFLLLETGVIGFVLYCVFFISVFFGANKMQTSGRGDVLYCQLAKIMAVMSIVFVIYNASMRTEAGYMVYFVLSLPFLRDEKQNNDAPAQIDAGKVL